MWGERDAGWHSEAKPAERDLEGDPAVRTLRGGQNRRARGAKTADDCSDDLRKAFEFVGLVKKEVCPGLQALLSCGKRSAVGKYDDHGRGVTSLDGLEHVESAPVG